jgi:hypothetical protein
MIEVLTIIVFSMLTLFSVIGLAALCALGYKMFKELHEGKDN